MDDSLVPYLEPLLTIPWLISIDVPAGQRAQPVSRERVLNAVSRTQEEPLWDVLVSRESIQQEILNTSTVSRNENY